MSDHRTDTAPSVNERLDQKSRSGLAKSLRSALSWIGRALEMRATQHPEYIAALVAAEKRAASEAKDRRR